MTIGYDVSWRTVHDSLISARSPEYQTPPFRVDVLSSPPRKG